MKTIVHTCSSVLIRPNGITRYINAVMDLQRSLGHHVIFVTDALPAQTINSDETLYISKLSGYVPHWKDGHVWLQVDPHVSYNIEMAFRKLDVEPDLVIAHDLHSYLGACEEFRDGVFIQHESDVLTPGSRYSFLSDEYLQKQIDVVETTDWRIGLTVHSQHIKPHRPVYTPAPFTPVAMPTMPKTKGLLYIGDATERKGAKEFMQLARDLGVKPTVITHEPDAELFAGADVHTFSLDQRDAMYSLMAQHQVAYIPSKNECPGLAAVECLQFMPVVVDGQYEWTRYLDDIGATRPIGGEILPTVEGYLSTFKTHDRRLLDIWAKNSKQYWINLSA